MSGRILHKVKGHVVLIAGLQERRLKLKRSVAHMKLSGWWKYNFVSFNLVFRDFGSSTIGLLQMIKGCPRRISTISSCM